MDEPKLRHLSVTIDQQGPNDPRPHWGIDRIPGCTVFKLGPVYVNISTWFHMQRQSLRRATLTRFHFEVYRWDGDLARARRNPAPHRTKD